MRPMIAPRNGAVMIAVVGKYIELQDAYKSIYEALRHGGIANDVGVEIKRVESERFESKKPESFLRDADAVLVPGGFGNRGIEGKIRAIQYAREQGIPYFGICLGMQCAVIEFARHVAGLKGAHSTEFDPATPHPVISLLAQQRKVKQLGGTMRLGAQPCQMKKGTLAYQAYKESRVQERHRHRYEFNGAYKDSFAKAGMVVSGYLPGKRLVEIVELNMNHHPWFVGCQFHPELKSKPDKCHPLFRAFVKAAMEYSHRKNSNAARPELASATMKDGSLPDGRQAGANPFGGEGRP